MCSRGILEIYIGKTVAYIIQLLLWVLLIVIIYCNKYRENNERLYSNDIILGGFFVIVAFISYYNTVLAKSFYIGIIYTLAMIWIFVSILISRIFKSRLNIDINFGLIISYTIVILGIVAILQQNRIITNLPGITWHNEDIRPSSLSGSYLHYPLIISVLSCVLLEIGNKLNNMRYMIISLFGMLLTITSYSRSGQMILVFTFILYLIRRIIISIENKKIKIKSLLLIIMSITISVVIIIGFDINILENEYIMRALSSINIHSNGNSDRLIAWKKGIEMWMNTNLIIGSNTGLVTNITGNFGGSSIVVESGVIQQMVNFGLIGCLLFYLNLALLSTAINKNFYIIKSTILACIFQSFIYQSIEIIPYIFILSILPNISQWLLSTIRINIRKE